ncbi:hypothetical protein [Ruminococcus albus]|uniref:Uncharacterized protein n=1 Tax=Ruminococcus albus TaxID=1264 RepID=A0A1H7HWN6_RUMAL|nr:hypothetical protein [Ruminococcus albus]SEK54002.1 hypothetical protein SAMN05216469_103105 [Ruminococcus albus]
MYNFGFYANEEMSARICESAEQRGFSGADGDGIRAAQRFCKGRTGADAAREMSAGSLANRAAEVFY